MTILNNKTNKYLKDIISCDAQQILKGTSNVVKVIWTNNIIEAHNYRNFNEAWETRVEFLSKKNEYTIN